MFYRISLNNLHFPQEHKLPRFGQITVHSILDTALCVEGWIWYIQCKEFTGEKTKILFDTKIYRQNFKTKMVCLSNSYILRKPFLFFFLNFIHTYKFKYRTKLKNEWETFWNYARLRKSRVFQTSMSLLLLPRLNNHALERTGSRIWPRVQNQSGGNVRPLILFFFIVLLCGLQKYQCLSAFFESFCRPTFFIAVCSH